VGTRPACMLDWSLQGGQDHYFKAIADLAAGDGFTGEKVNGDQQEVRHELPCPAGSFTRYATMSTTSASVDLIPTNSADTTLKTALCHMLGIEYPIVAAPMGPDLTGPETVAAVSNAGGLGILQAQFCAPPLFREEIHRVRALTDKPFGVNLLLHFPVEAHVAVCLEERVPVLSLFWGDPTPYVEPAHAAGVKVFHQVGSVPEAQRAAAAGVDVIVAQGVEAGGHVAGGGAPPAVGPPGGGGGAPPPPGGAGGPAGGPGGVAGLRWGGEAGRLGTRFLASAESRAHPHYKQRVLAADEGDTIRTILFGHGWPNAPHRTLRTAFVQQWLGQEGAWSRIAAGRTDGRPDGYRWATHA